MDCMKTTCKPASYVLGKSKVTYLCGEELLFPYKAITVMTGNPP